MARATTSSLKAHRSSMEPPPRPVIIRSAARCRLAHLMAAAISRGASSPWTRTGITQTSDRGHRAPRIRIMSRTAAPAGEVTRAIFLGNNGVSFLWAGSKRPSRASFSFSCSKARAKSPTPSGVSRAQYIWYCPSRGKTVTRPAAITCIPFSGRNRKNWASLRNMTHRSAPSPSFKVK